MNRVFSLLVFTLLTLSLSAQSVMAPSSEHLYATKDGQDLWLSVYQPSEGSFTTLDGKGKPTIVFLFGGGFTHGSRNDKGYLKWYKSLCDNGYRVVSIDYRLGLKGVKAKGIKFIRKVDEAIQMATDDLFSATAYLLNHASELGIHPAEMVVAGSSAGAITALQGEWELCNRHPASAGLPEDFHYAGVLSFAGAIFSKEGAIRYRDKTPCPHFLCHGTADKIVNYKQIAFFNLRFAGTDVISRTFTKKGYTCHILRFEGNSHEIAGCMQHLLPETLMFLETNVIRKTEKCSDALISDPLIQKPDWASKGYRSLY